MKVTLSRGRGLSGTHPCLPRYQSTPVNLYPPPSCSTPLLSDINTKGTTQLDIEIALCKASFIAAGNDQYMIHPNLISPFPYFSLNPILCFIKFHSLILLPSLSINSLLLAFFFLLPLLSLLPLRLSPLDHLPSHPHLPSPLAFSAH